MIAAFYDMQLIDRPHLATNARGHLQGTERIARVLHEHDRLGQVAQLAAITSAA